MADNIYIDGCFPKAIEWMNNNFIYIGTSIFIVAIIQVFFINNFLILFLHYKLNFTLQNKLELLVFDLFMINAIC